MGSKKVNYNKTNIGKLPNDKPAVYKIKTTAGNINYIGVAKRGRVNERIAEHLGKIPGSTVEIKTFETVDEARKNETAVIKRIKPKYNKKGK